MSETSGTPAGWYHNAQGEAQWWDGTAWGQLAGPGGGQATAQGAAPGATFAPAPVRPAKPRTSPLVWGSLAASGIAILCAILSYAVFQTRLNRALADDGILLAQSDGARAMAELLTNAVPVFALAALVLAIIGLVKSARKIAGSLAITLATLILVAPVLFWLGLALIWVGSGVFSQLSGGPVVG